MAQPKVYAETLIRDIAEGCDQHPGTVKAVLLHLAIEVKLALLRGEAVTIPGIAVLTPKDRPARTGRNPANGEPVAIPAKRVASARILPALTKSLN